MKRRTGNWHVLKSLSIHFPFSIHSVLHIFGGIVRKKHILHPPNVKKGIICATNAIALMPSLRLIKQPRWPETSPMEKLR
jgi:hypothetical protein